MYRVLTVPGIGEAPSTDGKPVGMLKNLTDKLPDRFISEHFNWRNQYGPVPVANGTAYDTNLGKGKDALVAKIAASKEEVVLVGYSGGAHLASLAAIGSTNIARLVLVANPSRRAGDSAAPFYGITGQHADFPAPLIDLANPADVICCCPPSQPLRDFADLSQHFSLSDVLAWGQALYSATIAGQNQGAFKTAKLEDWWQALAYARGYLFDGQHTNYYLPRLAEAADELSAALL